ncbi:BglG family transcription antiterminator [Listeria rocourtiae]|uniref:BglG family transcription antiterminator n=1 Tax=Listeria rocourtiae TaxID=647910 RepID=UPI001623676E|nr:BglG family transcription antiterminator [Listeria rocourtiae]MBC1436455.1 BglG family transcription antiterminator [Listeria rocourtiae]
MFDQRAFRLFEQIIRYEKMTSGALVRKMGLSERQFQYDFEKMNQALQHVGKSEIEVRNQVFIIDPKLKKSYLEGSELFIRQEELFLGEQDRVYLLYLYTFIRQEEISNFHYQRVLHVSRNTALSDVKKVRGFCAEADVRLVYSRISGYHLVGTERDKRVLAGRCVNALLVLPLGEVALKFVLESWGLRARLDDTERILLDWQKVNQVELVQDRQREWIYLATFLRCRGKHEGLAFQEVERELIEQQIVYQMTESLVVQLFGKAYLMEKLYVTVQLIGAQHTVEIGEHAILLDLADRIIATFEKLTLLTLDNKRELRQSLYNHLVPAYFRIVFSLPLVAPMTEQIKSAHSELFAFVKQALSPLAKMTGKTVNEAEIGYFTIHFGGYFERKVEAPREFEALLVCPNGISTSLMLKSQLRQLFPELRFAMADVGNIPESGYDMIFSTVYVPTRKPVYLVQPLLTSLEKNYLIQAVAADFPTIDHRHISVDALLEIIERHAVIEDEQKLYDAIFNKIYGKVSRERGYAPMLSELLTKDMIQFTDEELDWKEAIRLAATPLVTANRVKTSYVDAMIETVEELGTYIHIGKGIAIPHARPEKGVNQIGMSFLRARKPVHLMDASGPAIDIFICLAAVDNEAHLKALSQLMKFLTNDAALEKLKQAESVDEITRLLVEGEEQA